MDHHTSYGSDRAELVYGETVGGKLVHISTVERGLKCNCSCPGCGRKLVARTKAKKVVPHFAHYGPACGGAPETALHKLAKQIVEERLTLMVPKRIAVHENVESVLPGATNITLDSARVEFTEFTQIVPDLYVTVGERELLVEIAVTHFCDDDKILRIRSHGIAAIEIDLSGIARDAPSEAIAEAVLRAAPRKWLFNQGIDDAVSELKEAAQKKRISAETKLKAEARKIAIAYAEAVQSLAEQGEDIPEAAAFRAMGLIAHVGIKVDGYGCYTKGPTYWQAIVLAELLHRKKLRSHLVTAVPAANHLEKLNLVRPAFRRVTGELEAAIKQVDSRFAAPWRAVEAYLQHLMASDVVMRMTHGYTLSPALSSRWFDWSMAEEARVARIKGIRNSVEAILHHVPDKERGDFSVDTWLAMVEPKSGIAYGVLLETPHNEYDIAAELRAIEGLFNSTLTDVIDFLGLPIVRACERQLAKIANEQARQNAEALQRAEKAKQQRRDEIAADAEKVLSGPGAWLNTPHNGLDGLSPIDAAEDGIHRLRRAKELLHQVQRQREAEQEVAAERRHFQDKLTTDAVRRLGDAEAQTFLNGRDDDLSRAPPLLFVKNERTYQMALRKLSEWEREFVRSYPRK